MPDPLYQYEPFGRKEIPDDGIPDIEEKWNVEISDYGFTGVTIHKVDDTFDSREHGCCRTMCGIHYACATITYDDVNCPECEEE